MHIHPCAVRSDVGRSQAVHVLSAEEVNVNEITLAEVVHAFLDEIVLGKAAFHSYAVLRLQLAVGQHRAQLKLALAEANCLSQTHGKLTLA